MIKAQNIEFSYDNKRVFKFPDVLIEAGEQKLLSGPSGCGKTTFLNIVSLFIQDFKGQLIINNTDVKTLSKKQADFFRSENIGIIFQEPFFVASLNVFDNINLASKLSKQELDLLLIELGISDLKSKKVNTLSLGEKQRVGIARVIAQKPKLILADEPTSSLDDLNANKVTDLLVEQSKKNGAALLIVTHDQRIKDKIKSVVEL